MCNTFFKVYFKKIKKVYFKVYFKKCSKNAGILYKMSIKTKSKG